MEVFKSFLARLDEEIEKLEGQDQLRVKAFLAPIVFHATLKEKGVAHVLEESVRNELAFRIVKKAVLDVMTETVRSV